MEHATALVDHDATTPTICGCQRLVDAGWAVRCFACGRVTEAAGVPALLEVQHRAPGTHTCMGCEACYDERIADLEADDVDLADRDYDAQRDDVAERRVA